MDTLDIDSLLRATGAVLEGHFKLTSGRHSSIYVEKFRIMEQPELTSALCGMIAEHYRDAGAGVVAGPAMGGVILAYETARHLGVRSIFSEKDENGGLVLDRGFKLQEGEPVLVVDDVLTTGGSVQRMVSLLRRAGARVVGVGLLVDRTDGSTDFGAPFYACHRMPVESFAPEACPLCKQGLELVET